MTRLVDLARVVRSKNAGPLYLTLDLLFPDMASFGIALASPRLSPAAIARLYGVAEGEVEVVAFAAAQAIKIVLPRPVVAGDFADPDVYGAQQHRPLLDLVL